MQSLLTSLSDSKICAFDFISLYSVISLGIYFECTTWKIKRPSFLHVSMWLFLWDRVAHGCTLERSRKGTSHGLCRCTRYDKALLTGVVELAERERHVAVSGNEWSYHTFQFTYFPTHINSKKYFLTLGNIHGGSGGIMLWWLVLYCLNLAKLEPLFPACPSLGGSRLGLATEEKSERYGNNLWSNSCYPVESGETVRCRAAHTFLLLCWLTL